MSEEVYTSDLSYRGQSRHLLVFLDGTWNDENGKENDGITTNIYKLFRTLEGKLTEGSIPHVIEHEKHIALYFRGIGNDDDNSMLGSIFYGMFGGSEKRIRDHAYVNIIKHYRKGDKISIFGFSRGAATARLLTSDLNENGIVKSVEVEYKKEKNESTNKTELVYKKHKEIDVAKVKNVPVHFLGIFDTVGAFGIPVDIGFGFQKMNLFKDLTVSENAKQVVHCVSIDESRKPFIPTLCNNADNVDEVWFAGVHSDVGGGYRHNSLSKIPLNYMLDKLKSAFADDLICFDQSKLDSLIKLEPTPEFLLHYHGDGFVKARRDIHVLDNEKPSKKRPNIHKSVFELMDSKYVFLSTPVDGFCKVESIRYFPKSISGLQGRCSVKT